MISIIIPIHNERSHLETAVRSLTRELTEAHIEDYEIILIENGSDDWPELLATAPALQDRRIRHNHLDTADYGLALRHGMQHAEGEFLFTFDIDYWDVTFIRKCLALFAFEYDIIIASKNMLLSRDTRSMSRRAISQIFRAVLHLFFRLKVSDTHGMKGWRNTELLKDRIGGCRFSRHIFDTELIIRLGHRHERILEIPVAVAEHRKGNWSIWRRVPATLLDLTRLWFLLFIKGNV